MWHRIHALVIKELQALLRDRQSRMLLVVPVLLQLALFPNAATLEVKNAALGILNQDTGSEADELITRLGQAKAFGKLVFLSNPAELTQRLDNQEVLLVLHLSSDFSRQIVAGDSASLQILIDGRRSNSGQIAQGYLQRILQQFVEDRRAWHDLPVESTPLQVRHWFNPNLHYLWFILPSLVAIITTSSAMAVSALSVAREKEQGTLDQLLVSPLTLGMIMLGKTVPAILISFGQGTIILLGGILVYGVPFQGSFVLLYLSLLAYAVSLAGFGFLIASICRTQQQAFLGVFSFMMPAVLLSGFASPIDNMPAWLQTLTWINPLRHFVLIMKGIFLKDIDAGILAGQLWPLIVIGVVTMTLARWSFQRHWG